MAVALIIEDLKTDGDAALVTQIYKAGITISTVATGGGMRPEPDDFAASPAATFDLLGRRKPSGDLVREDHLIRKTSQVLRSHIQAASPS